jgi:hypothetical protein
MAGAAPLSLPPANLSPWRCYALYHLRAAKTPLTRASLARILDSSQTATGSLLLGLRADGLVRRLDNGEQGYVVTPDGITAVTEYFRSMEALAALWDPSAKTVSDTWQGGQR